jgi:hypothetical protein
MPEKEIEKRGGAIRWRTVKTPDGKVIHIAVVRKAGPKGGHTIAGPKRTPKNPSGKASPKKRG